MVSNTWRPFKFGCRHSALFRMQIMYKRIKQHNQHPFLNGLSATRNPHEHAQPERHPGLCRIAPTVRQSPYEQCSCANDSLWPHLHLDMSVHLWGIRLSLWKVGGEACNTASLRPCSSLADGKCSHRFRGSLVLPGASLRTESPRFSCRETQRTEGVLANSFHEALQTVVLFPKNANLQDIDGRCRIGSGMASLTNADSHHSRRFPTFQLKICPHLTSFTNYLWWQDLVFKAVQYDGCITYFYW